MMATVETPRRVLIPPRSARSTRYHRPVADGSLRPCCDAFEAGIAVALSDAVDELGRHRCGNCWGEQVRTDGGRPAFEDAWMDPPHVRRWLADQFIGYVVNFPCGRSPLGHLRLDIDPGVSPDGLADLLAYPHDDLPEADTLYCDPPYEFYESEEHAWIRALWDLTERRLILQSPLVSVRLPGAEKRWHVVDARPGQPGGRARAFQLFDRADARLGDYGRAD